MSWPSTCYSSSDTILLVKDSMRKDILDKNFNRLADVSIDYAWMCYLVLTFFHRFLRVQFTSSIRPSAQLFAREPSLMATTSINYTFSNYIQTQLVYACDMIELGKYSLCNVDIYYHLLSGELFWLFDQNYTQLGQVLKPMLYEDKGGTNQYPTCFVQHETDAIACRERVCFGRQILNETSNTLFNCGIPASHSIDQDKDNLRVIFNIRTQLCLHDMQYSEIFYTCNIEKCNGQDTLDQVSRITSQYYDIRNLQAPFYLNHTKFSSTYCQTSSGVSTSSTTSSTTSTTKLRTTTRTSTTRSQSATTVEKRQTTTFDKITTSVSSTIQQSSVMSSAIPSTMPMTTIQPAKNTAIPLREHLIFIFLTSLLL
ncbi:unnamed protein product [Adineta ricciae]|uniref:ZP domain-containing protein n=1 Tax=Adineta ricciae TaxID=249248 RepID=A0A814SM00_ADIRI|nr:unnamed protein product [Adineta ricciae]CAF1319573.1 unnamed protein product [Adineta ricciae]